MELLGAAYGDLDEVFDAFEGLNQARDLAEEEKTRLENSLTTCREACAAETADEAEAGTGTGSGGPAQEAADTEPAPAEDKADTAEEAEGTERAPGAEMTEMGQEADAAELAPDTKRTEGAEGTEATDGTEDAGAASAAAKIISDHLAKIRDMAERANAAIGQCDVETYKGAIAVGREQTEVFPLVAWRMSEADQESQKENLKAAIAEAEALVAAIPPYPDPCETANVYYPEYEYIITQNTVSATGFKWAAFICDMEAERRFQDTYFTIAPALRALRAEAASLAAGDAAPGSEEYEEQISQGRLGKLILTIDDFLETYEKWGIREADVQHLLVPGDWCQWPEQVQHNRAQMPSIEAWMDYTGASEQLNSWKASYRVGNIPVRLPDSVRNAAIAAGMDLPPYASLVEESE